MLGKLIQNRYQIIHFLSASEFGQTYLAKDTHLNNRPTCVVKHIKTSNDSDLQTIKDQFTREVEALKKLDKYDKIPRLLDYYEENQEFFLVEQFIPGHPLSDELQPDQCWQERSVVQLLQEALNILAFVHSHGLIHRDIKPSNLLRRESDQQLMLTNFGSAKQAWTQVVTSQGQTSTRFAIGVPATIAIGTHGYMPTEQELGRPRPNSDIYALGIIAIEALTGVSPTELLHDRDTGEILWQERVRVNNKLAYVLNKMVRYHFKDRYQSATEALEALQALAILYPLPHREEFVLQEPSRKQEASLQPSLIAPKMREVSSSGKETVAVLPRKLESLTSDRPSHTIRTYPRKPLLLGIAASLAGALVLAIASYYSLFSPSPEPIQTSPVAIPIKNTSLENISLAKTLTGHLSSVWSVVISTNGETLVSGSEDQTIKVWNLNNGQVLQTLSGHTDTIRTMTLSRDGQLLASGSSDNTIKLWNLQTGELVRTLYGHSGTIWSVALSRDRQTLVSGSEDQTIKIWHLPSGKLRQTLKAHSDRVFSVAISPDGQTLASGSQDQTIKVWNLQTGELIRTLSGHNNAVRTVVFTPDGQQLATGSWDKTIKIWNLPTGELIRTLTGHSDRVVSIAFSFNGQTLASTGVDKTIKIWNVQTGQIRRDIPAHSDWVLSIATNSTKQLLVSSSKDKTIKIWQ